MVIILVMPTLASAGVPVSAPVRGVEGGPGRQFVAVKVSGSPSGSAAVGVKEYGAARVDSAVAGAPAMIGGQVGDLFAVAAAVGDAAMAPRAARR